MFAVVCHWSDEPPRDRAHDLMSPTFLDALAYASALHREQRRKGTETPYVSHLLAVAAIVMERGGTETQAVAALLHDAIEDHPRGGKTRQEIQERFGEDVLAIVQACTDADEHPKPPWKERKQRYLTHLTELPAAARLVVLADKVHNARAILSDFQTVGDAVWQRFNATEQETLWYYSRLADTFLKTDGGALAQELERVVSELQSQAAGSPPDSSSAREQLLDVLGMLAIRGSWTVSDLCRRVENAVLEIDRGNAGARGGRARPNSPS